jgi:hypothetical protein
LQQLSCIKRCVLFKRCCLATPPIHRSSTQQILTSSINLDITFRSPPRRPSRWSVVRKMFTARLVSRSLGILSRFPVSSHDFPVSSHDLDIPEHADPARLLVGDKRLVRCGYVMQDDCYLRNDLTENRRRRACAFPKRQRYQEEAGRTHYFRYPTICYHHRTKGTAQQSPLKDLELTPPSHCMTMLSP